MAGEFLSLSRFLEEKFGALWPVTAVGPLSLVGIVLVLSILIFAFSCDTSCDLSLVVSLQQPGARSRHRGGMETWLVPSIDCCVFITDVGQFRHIVRRRRKLSLRCSLIS